jgi:hypothetical protein
MARIRRETQEENRLMSSIGDVVDGLDPELCLQVLSNILASIVAATAESEAEADEIAEKVAEAIKRMVRLYPLLMSEPDGGVQ